MEFGRGTYFRLIVFVCFCLVQLDWTACISPVVWTKSHLREEKAVMAKGEVLKLGESRSYSSFR